MPKPGALYAARYLFDEDSQWYYLPQVLNHYKVDLDDFCRLRILDKPALVYTTLRALSAQRRIIGKPVLDRDLAAARRYWKSLPRRQRKGSLGTYEARALAEKFGLKELAKTGGWASLIRKDFLLREFYTQDNQVVSVVRGTFSYDDSADYDGERALWSAVECPECSHEEHVREQFTDTHEGRVAMLEHYAEDFTHISGPYARCPDCGCVVRPSISPADSLPDSATLDGDPDAWYDYGDHLDELVQDLAGHLKAHGLPKPDGLRLDVSNADWRGRDAWAECGLSGQKLRDKMRVNGEFCVRNGELRLHQDGRAELRCSMHHHDVPMGSGIGVFPYWECELSGEHLDFEQVQRSNLWVAAVASNLLTGRDREFQYSPSCEFSAVSLPGLIEDLETLVDNLGLTLDEVADEGDGFTLATALVLDGMLEKLRRGDRVADVEARLVRKALDAWMEYRDQMASAA